MVILDVPGATCAIDIESSVGTDDISLLRAKSPTAEAVVDGLEKGGKILRKAPVTRSPLSTAPSMKTVSKPKAPPKKSTNSSPSSKSTGPSPPKDDIVMECINPESQVLKPQKPPKFKFTVQELQHHSSLVGADVEQDWRRRLVDTYAFKGPVLSNRPKPHRLTAMNAPSESQGPPNTSRPAEDERLTARSFEPLMIDVYSVKERRWVKVAISALQESVS